jgi:hypothetical protein
MGCILHCIGDVTLLNDVFGRRSYSLKAFFHIIGAWLESCLSSAFNLNGDSAPCVCLMRDLIVRRLGILVYRLSDTLVTIEPKA